MASYLGLDAVGLIRSALRVSPELELDQLRGELPELVCRVLARAGKSPAGNGLERGYLEALEARKRKDPAGTLKQIGRAVDYVAPAELLWLLGVAGFASRRLLQSDEAEHSVYAAVHLAQRRRDTVLTARLLRLMSELLNDRGEHTRALALAERAAGLFLRCGVWNQLARPSLIQGLTLHYLGRYDDALRAVEGYLESVSDFDLRLRFSAHQVLGLTLCRQGALAPARVHLQKASTLASKLSPLSQGQAMLGRGAVALRSGLFAEADSFLSRAATKLRSRNPHLEALAMTGLLRLRLLQGQPEDADLLETTIRANLETSRRAERIRSAIRRHQTIFGSLQLRASWLTG